MKPFGDSFCAAGPNGHLCPVHSFGAREPTVWLLSGWRWQLLCKLRADATPIRSPALGGAAPARSGGQPQAFRIAGRGLDHNWRCRGMCASCQGTCGRVNSSGQPPTPFLTLRVTVYTRNAVEWRRPGNSRSRLDHNRSAVSHRWHLSWANAPILGSCPCCRHLTPEACGRATIYVGSTPSSTADFGIDSTTATSID